MFSLVGGADQTSYITRLSLCLTQLYPSSISDTLLPLYFITAL
jgi:hypothetical protein